jgi:hypothetical protein
MAADTEEKTTDTGILSHKTISFFSDILTEKRGRSIKTYKTIEIQRKRPLKT